MATDKTTIANWPDSGSPQRVALDLANRIHAGEHGTHSVVDRKAYLDLYAECLQATHAYRDWQKTN